MSIENNTLTKLFASFSIQRYRYKKGSQGESKNRIDCYVDFNSQLGLFFNSLCILFSRFVFIHTYAYSETFSFKHLLWVENDMNYFVFHQNKV